MFARVFLLALGLLLALVCESVAADRLRLAIQKTGTTGWELAVVGAFGLDKEAGLELAVTELASTEAGKIALQGGAADMIISDWLWVARERGQGAKLAFYPASTAIGAVMTKDPALNGIKDLAGKKLGVAGGPVDKSWLMLKAYALKQGVDLEKSATILYGAPPLLAEKAAQGELDAVLEFWNFAVDLEAKGFTRMLDLVEVEKGLGAAQAPIVTGYVFDEGFAAKKAQALARFFAMMARAKELIVKDDKAFAVAAQRIGPKDKATLALYRARYAAGVPKRAIAEEEADAAALYAALAQIGGEKLVGPAKALDPGVFYKAAPSEAKAP